MQLTFYETKQVLGLSTQYKLSFEGIDVECTVFNLIDRNGAPEPTLEFFDYDSLTAHFNENEIAILGESILKKFEEDTKHFNTLEMLAKSRGLQCISPDGLLYEDKEGVRWIKSSMGFMNGSLVREETVKAQISELKELINYLESSNKELIAKNRNLREEVKKNQAPSKKSIKKLQLILHSINLSDKEKVVQALEYIKRKYVNAEEHENV